MGRARPDGLIEHGHGKHDPPRPERVGEAGEERHRRVDAALGDECPPAFDPDDQPGCDQVEQRLADGGKADAELFRVFVLGRQPIAGPQFAGLNPCVDGTSDLVMERSGPCPADEGCQAIIL